MNAEYASQFRRHYFFWLDDQISASAADALEDAFKEPDLFQLSMARGLYSTLQVLDAIRRFDLPRFDIAILDVRLKDSNRYFIRLESTADTSPRSEYPIYIHDKAELNKVAEFSGPEKFAFNFQSVKSQARENGGLLAWAWAFQICRDAKYIIYSASESAKSKIEFLQIAGILEVCNKGDLFHVASIEDQMDAFDHHYSSYGTLVEQCFAGTERIKYFPFSGTGESGELLSENAVVEKSAQDFVPHDYFGSAQWREYPENAFVLHELDSSGEGSELTVIYERYLDFEKRITEAPAKPYIVEKLIEVIHSKIERGEIDTVLTRAILAGNSHQIWTVQIGVKPPVRLLGHLLPLGGQVDLDNRTIKLDEREARATYSFPAFFLPWGQKLLRGTPAEIQDAQDEIRKEFGDKLKNGVGLIKVFCKDREFHPFIEIGALSRSSAEAAQARRLFDSMNVDSVLLKETTTLIKSYLEAGPPYHNWQAIKEKVELTFKALLGRIEKRTKTFDTNWTAEIFPSRDDLPSGKWYADMEWIGTVLDTVFDNLASNKAFDVSRGFDDTPLVKVSLRMEESEPARISIVVEDNGVGLDVNSLVDARTTSYHTLRQGQYGKLLQCYGRLTIRSTNGEYDLETQRVRSERTTSRGTLVTFSVILGLELP